ncbi:hypothetical protein FRC08_000112, partial [Ceratobasidium sp. 394]
MAAKRKATSYDVNDGSRKKRAKRVPKDYPSNLPSRTLTPAHNHWLSQYQDEYASRVGKRGAPDSAFAWVRSIIVDKFLDKWFPELNKATCEQFRPWIGTSINTRFNNRFNFPNIVDPSAVGKVPSSSMYLWSRDNQALVDDTWAERCMQNPSLIGNPGKRRGHVSMLWGRLTPEQKLTYKQRYEQLKKEKLTKVVPQEEKLKFLSDLLQKLSSMSREAERKAGVFVEARIAVEVDGVLSIEQVGSPLGEKYLKSGKGAIALNCVQEWLTKTTGNWSILPNNGPQVAVIPVREDHMRPLVPDITKHQPVLQLLRSMVRTTISAIWQLYGGVGGVPYEEIAQAMGDGDYSWIPPTCFPADVPFKESGYLTADQCCIWLKCLARWKFGALPTDFRFSKVYVLDGESLPARPEASSREPSTRGGAPAWIATYGKPIEHPQNVRPIYYPKSSWDYLYFTQNGAPGLDHWVGLPCRSEVDAVTQGPISTAEFQHVEKLFANCAPRIRSVVTDLMMSLNKMEAKFPVWTVSGIWEKVEGRVIVPAVLPSTQPSGRDAWLAFWRDHWMNIGYFQRPRRGMELTSFGYAESWVQDGLTGGPIFHERSGTLVGGSKGVVWKGRAVIKMLANIAAVIEGGGVEFNCPLPPGYDRNHLGPSHLELTLQMAKDLIAAVDQSTRILASSWAERCQPVDFESDEPADPDLRPSSIFPFDDGLFDDPPIASGSGRQASSSQQPAPFMLDDVSSEECNLSAIESEAEESVDGKGKGKQNANEKGERKGNGEGEGPAAQKERGKEKKGEAEEGKLSTRVKQYVAKNATAEEKWAAERGEALENYRKLKEVIDDEPVIEQQERLTQEQRRAAFDRNLAEWVDKDSMFDQSLSFEPATPDIIPPESFGTEVDKYVGNLSALMDEWRACADEWADPYDCPTIERAMRAAYIRRTEFPSLVYAIALHGNFVHESRDWYTKNFHGHRQHMYGQLSIGAALVRRVNALEQSGQLPKLQNGTIDRLRSVVWQVNQMHTQYVELEALALRYRNRMKDGYRHPRVDFTLGEIVDIAECLRDWTEEAAKFYVEQDRRMLEEWVNADCVGFTRPKPTHFTYGNPPPFAFDDSAQAELVRARHKLAERHAKET